MKIPKVCWVGRIPAHGTPSKPPGGPRPGHQNFEPIPCAIRGRLCADRRCLCATAQRAGLWQVGAGSNPAPYPLPPCVVPDCVCQHGRDDNQEADGKKSDRDINHVKPLSVWVCVDEVTLRQAALPVKPLYAWKVIFRL